MTDHLTSNERALTFTMGGGHLVMRAENDGDIVRVTIQYGKEPHNWYYLDKEEATKLRALLTEFIGDAEPPSDDRRDAARYRFLRQPGNAIVYAKDRNAWGDNVSGHVAYDTPERLDAAIDAAIGAAVTKSEQPACKPLMHIFWAQGESCLCGAVPWGQPSNSDPTKWDGPSHVCIDNKTHIGAKERCSRCPAVETSDDLWTPYANDGMRHMENADVSGGATDQANESRPSRITTGRSRKDDEDGRDN